MWTHLKEDGKTEKAYIPTDGVISFTIPSGTEICPYVNDVAVPIHHVHVKAGDSVYFEVTKFPESEF